MNRIIYSSNFDPIQLADIDLLKRALSFSKEVIMAMPKNNNDNFLPLENKLYLAQQVINEEFGIHNDNIHVVTYDVSIEDLSKQFGNCCLLESILVDGNFVDGIYLPKKSVETIYLISDIERFDSDTIIHYLLNGFELNKRYFSPIVIDYFKRTVFQAM